VEEAVVLNNSFAALDTTPEAKIQSQEREKERSPKRTKWKKGELVINLSDHKLSQAEKQVLQLGLKFAPYPSGMNMFGCLKDITAFQRRMRLKEFFHDSETTEKPPDWLKQKKNSNFTPPKHRESNLDTYLSLVASDTLKLLKTNTDKDFHNLTEDQEIALKTLMENKKIIVKAADKGGSLVVMNHEDYKEAILDMLKDEKFYREVNQDLNPGFEDGIAKCIDEMKKNNLINEKEADYLRNESPRTPTLYGLPKIHKDFITFPSFRPIVSGCKSCCEHISNFVDFHLKPLMKKNSSFIKDTTDFINKIKSFKCEEGSILVSADVSGLYTVINHEEGAAACKEALNMRSAAEKKSMPTRFITRLILLILKSNCFCFFGRFFHQLTGTAMGTPMAPSYANIFMGKVEKQMLNDFRKKQVVVQLYGSVTSMMSFLSGPMELRH
jgi:hypothetical protein